MSVVLPFWTIPLSLTVIIWAAGIYWPKGHPGGGYDFGPAIIAAVHYALAIIATLIVWLIFFVVF